MKLLILGGTRFLGRHLVNAALQAGHEITLFNRGISNPDLFPFVERIQGNRETDLAKLDGRTWDAVIDTCGYVPRIVRNSAEQLAAQVGSYVFISTVSVYADFSKPGTVEESDLASLADPMVEEISGETYGGLKVLCEQAVETAVPTKALIIRPGLIVGPFDPTDRFTYWPWRVMRGGSIAVPIPANFPVQFIDVRDLAEWTIAMVEQRRTGIFNATGPQHSLTFDKLLETCQSVSETFPKIIEVSGDFILSRNIQPWSQIPLWIPGDEYAGMSRVSISKAVQAGLSFRSLEETVRDTLVWAETRGKSYEMRAGLPETVETELLEAWEKHLEGQRQHRER